MLSKYCKYLPTEQLLSRKNIFIPAETNIPLKLLAPLHGRYQVRHPQSKFISVKSSANNVKSPKIRTYVNYEKDFVQLQVSKCYSCYIVASAVGLAIAYEFWSNVKDTKPFSYLQNLSKIKQNNEKVIDIEETNKANVKEKSYYLTRFESYATIEVDGKCFMTPRDFMDSVIYADDDHTRRARRRKISPEEVGYMLHIVPRIYDKTTVREALSPNPQLFRSLGAHGIISYSEYLFLLSLLTRPKRGLRNAFDVINSSDEETIQRHAFFQFMKIATAPQFQSSVRNTSYIPKNKSVNNLSRDEKELDTTLSVHFFGMIDKSIKSYHNLSYDGFYAFVRGLHRELLIAEFEEYSRGHHLITEEDFADIILKYTAFDKNECVKRMLWLSSLPENERVGIQFRDFELFCRLLKNLDDFSVAVKYISEVGRPLSRKEFKRAAKVCLNGKELSSHLVDTVFILFGASKGHDELSIDEFRNAMKHRLKRRVGIPINRKGSWQSFKKCFRQNLRDERKMPKQPL